MKVEEKNESILKQDQSNNSQNKEDTDVIIEKDKSKGKKNNEEESLESKNIEEPNDKKVKDLEDKILRTLAEMENQRRRFEKERDKAFEFGGFAFAKESLALIDNLERAKQSLENDETLKNSEALKKTLEHLEIINKDLISIFKKNNIEPIDSVNKKLDPNIHQAMMEIENDQKEPGTIIQEIQKGFMMKDRLLRPALVGVAKKFEKNKNDTKKDKKNEQNQEKSIKK